MIKIPKEDKPKLNKLISFYRHELCKTDERYLPKNFIMDKDNSEICTVYTLSRIENNKTCSYDSIYYALFDNMNMKYISDPKVDEIIHTVNLSILKSAEYNDTRSMMNKINKIVQIMSPFLNYALYKEQSEVYQIIIDYYEGYEFNTALIDKYNKLFDLVDEPLKPILIEITFICYTRIYLDAEKSYHALKQITNCKIDSIISEYVLLLLYFREYKLCKERSLGDKLILRCKNENNKIYLCKTYNILASLYTQQNPMLAMDYLQKAINNFDKLYDTNHNFSIYITNLSILACMHNLYELALENFKVLEVINPESILIIFPYYLYSLEKCQFDISEITNILKYLNKNYHKIESSIYVSIYHIFDMKYTKNSNFNIEFTINELSKNIAQLEMVQPILNIIETELYDICKDKNCLSLYKKFMKTFH